MALVVASESKRGSIGDQRCGAVESLKSTAGPRHCSATLQQYWVFRSLRNGFFCSNCGRNNLDQGCILELPRAGILRRDSCRRHGSRQDSSNICILELHVCVAVSANCPDCCPCLCDPCLGARAEGTVTTTNRCIYNSKSRTTCMRFTHFMCGLNCDLILAEMGASR